MKLFNKAFTYFVTAFFTALLIGMSAQSIAQTKDDALLQAATNEQPNVLKTLERLVNIESGSTQIEGLTAIGSLLHQELQSMGAQVSRVKSTVGTGAENIVGKFTGKGKTRILMMAHMDTVYGKGILERAPFKIDGDKAYGPGIADAKGGIAVILHAIKLLKAKGADNYANITVLFNSDEETGSNGSSALITSLAKDSDFVLSYEPNVVPKEMVVLATSGAVAVNVTITGKAAHAGASPELGINALTEAADFILRTQDIDDKANNLRFNWTIANSGGTRNVIPEKAEISADFRYATPDQVEKVTARLNELAAKPKFAGSKIEVRTTIGRPAFVAGVGGEKLIEKAKAIYNELGLTMLTLPRTGGGTDAAYAGLNGTPVLEGLGIPGANYHSNSAEYISISSIARRLYLSVRLIGELSASER
jgi:glutamate carboxypeptidase